MLDKIYPMFSLFDVVKMNIHAFAFALLLLVFPACGQMEDRGAYVILRSS